MFFTFRSSSLPFAATLLVSLLAGCASSKALETSDNARSPSNVPPSDNATYAQAPGSGAPEDRSYEGGPARQRGEAEDDTPTSAAVGPRADEAGASSKSAAGPSLRAFTGDAESNRLTARSRSTGRSSAPSYPPREERPGLATTWGENRSSRVHEVDFVRQSASNPFGIMRIQYNDHQGLVARLGEYSLDNFVANSTQSPNRFVTVEIVDPSGAALPGLVMGERTYVLGQHGDRYAIRLRNNERQRFEVLATVDGLDVIDGKAGSYGKRGYVLNGYDTLLIEGFRRSSNDVAAFRFGSVRDSYSAQSGKGDRNVGVIGIALFEERMPDPVYTDRELELRETADPFPSRYARPPMPRDY